MPDDPKPPVLQRVLSNFSPSTMRTAGEWTPTPITNLLIRLFGGSGTSAGGANLVPEDVPYLNQYLYPDLDVLPRQSLRPSSATIPSGRVVRQTPLPDTFLGALRQQRTQDYVEGDTNSPRLARDFPVELLEKLKIGEILSQAEPYQAGGQTQTLRGLGRYTGSLGRDAEGLFWSAYDPWDFTSPSITPQIRGYMEGAGVPFTVYDKFSVTPDESAPGGYSFTRRMR